MQHYAVFGAELVGFLVALGVMLIVFVRALKTFINSEPMARVLDAAARSRITAAFDTVDRVASAVVAGLDVTYVQPRKDPSKPELGDWTPTAAARAKAAAVASIRAQAADEIPAIETSLKDLDAYLAGLVERKVAELRSGSPRVVVSLPAVTNGEHKEERTPAETPSALARRKEKP